MHALVSKKELESTVFRAEKLTGKNTTLTTLQTILITTHKNTLVLRATNLDVGIEITLPATIKQKGSVAVRGETLSTLLSNTPNTKEITLSSEKGTLFVVGGENEAKLKTYPTEDFPTLPTPTQPKKTSLPAKDFARGLKSVWYCASSSNMKPELASVLVKQEGGRLLFVATDSFRLAEKKITIKGADGFEQLLIPVKNVGEIIRNLELVEGAVDVFVGENQASFVSPNTHITTRVIDGAFPDYTQIIPKDFVVEATLLKEDFLTSLKLAVVFANKFNQVRFCVDPNKKLFVVETSNPEIGESRTPIDAALSGEKLEMGFNYRYVFDSLQAVGSDSVSLKFSGEGKPLVIQGVGDGSFLYLVMPMNR